MAIETIYAGVLLLSAVAPWLAYRAKNYGEAVIWSAIGTVLSWAFLTWAVSVQQAVLFWVGGGLFLINVFELAVAVFAPLLKSGEEE